MKIFTPYYPTLPMAEDARVALKNSILMWDKIDRNRKSKSWYVLKYHKEVGGLHASCYLCDFSRDLKHTLRTPDIGACSWCPLDVLVKSCTDDRIHYQINIHEFAAYQHDCLKVLTRQISTMRKKGTYNG